MATRQTPNRHRFQEVEHHPHLRAFFFFGLLTALVIGLVIAWRGIPVPGSTNVTAAPEKVLATEIVSKLSGNTTTTPVIAPPRILPPGMVCGDDGMICVDQDWIRATPQNPFVVTGTVVGDQMVHWSLLDVDKNSLLSGTTLPSDTASEPGEFSFRVFIAGNNGKPVMLSLFRLNKTGLSPIERLDIPLILAETLMDTTVFLVPMNMASSTDCGRAVPFRTRTVQSAKPIEAALRTLLDVHPSWQYFGNVTQLPEKVRLVSFELKNGVAKAVFSPELDEGVGGSCRVLAIRAQIEKTLKQFSSVRTVVISVEGKTPEETLQP